MARKGEISLFYFIFSKKSASSTETPFGINIDIFMWGPKATIVLFGKVGLFFHPYCVTC